MKINGKTMRGPAIEIIPIPRPHDEDIIFKAQAILDYEPFEKLCPRPKPPMSMKPGQEPFQNIEDADYKLKIAAWSQQRLDWMIIQSLSVTPGLEWERVKAGDPNTWTLWQEELKGFGLTPNEQIYLQNKIFGVNWIDDAKVEQARARFLATEAAAN